MMFAAIAILLLSTAPAFIWSLQCNVCRRGIALDFILTPDNVPALPGDCTVAEGSACWVNIFWDLNFNRTFLELRERPGSATNPPSRDVVGVRIVRGMERDNHTLSTGREVDYECDSSDKCNGPDGIKKILRSISVEDQFQQEIAPLLKLIFPFDPREADCGYFHNQSVRCPPPDLRRCRRCLVEAGQQKTRGEDVCATCEADDSRDNFVERFKVFNVTDPTQDMDFAAVGCQLKGCNTLRNVNLVYQASKITFNTKEYLKN